MSHSTVLDSMELGRCEDVWNLEPDKSNDWESSQPALPRAPSDLSFLHAQAFLNLVSPHMEYRECSRWRVPVQESAW